LKQILGGEIDKTLIFHDGKEEWVFTLAGCVMGEMIVRGEFSRQGNTNHNLQQLQFIGHRLWDLLPRLSKQEDPKNSPLHREELISGHTMVDKELLLILLSTVNPFSNPLANKPYKLRYKLTHSLTPNITAICT
jgi:hypothetical protein